MTMDKRKGASGVGDDRLLMIVHRAEKQHDIRQRHL